MARGYVRWRDDGKIVTLYKEVDGKKKVVRDARWGDYLNVQEEGIEGGWTRILWGKETMFIKSENVVPTRPLEVIFIDVGQGDGCVFISPETETDPNAPEHLRERIMVIDAGEAGNMMGFLRWRFAKLETKFQFHAAVMTHPDQDHYWGFRSILNHPNVGFDALYHNGILERPTGQPPLGPSDASGRYLTEIAETDADVRRLYKTPAQRGSKQYARLMHTAMSSGRVGTIQMLSSPQAAAPGTRAYVPGFDPASARKATIEVLGPIVEPDPNGKARLRWFGDKIGSAAQSVDKTKNGHSVILRLEYGGFRLLFGGDLNQPSEDFLLRQYGGTAASKPLKDAIAEASKRLRSDMLKCCHHGASDVTDEFIKAVEPFAYVVSSGDEESHAHPRPDLLGRLGKLGRTDAPLLLCTELLRSTREKGRSEDFKKLQALDKLIDAATTSDADKTTARKERKDLQERIQRRNVGVYGSITVRTDGTRMEISFQLEKPRGTQRWQRYRYKEDATAGWIALQ
jgi:beta-lactamase superfamily II metal-dependent hydrolase